jgi:hypothetical protein
VNEGARWTAFDEDLEVLTLSTERGRSSQRELVNSMHESSCLRDANFSAGISRACNLGRKWVVW